MSEWASHAACALTAGKVYALLLALEHERSGLQILLFMCEFATIALPAAAQQEELARYFAFLLWIFLILFLLVGPSRSMRRTLLRGILCSLCSLFPYAPEGCYPVPPKPLVRFILFHGLCSPPRPLSGLLCRLRKSLDLHWVRGSLIGAECGSRYCKLRLFLSHLTKSVQSIVQFGRLFPKQLIVSSCHRRMHCHIWCCHGNYGGLLLSTRHLRLEVHHLCRCWACCWHPVSRRFRLQFCHCFKSHCRVSTSLHCQLHLHLHLHLHLDEAELLLGRWLQHVASAR
mmetsp:Transcript_113673/g.208964  ORF Transcript_113673/g.208964 Transcript_113673/m.208964 type:complete len:285 (-) Transcript_113673:61-915(-)